MNTSPTPKLMQGCKALLVRGKRRCEVTVIRDHWPTFPAVTIKYRNEDWIVGRNELLDDIQLENEARERIARERESLKDIIDAFDAGHKTMRAIASAINCQMIDILSKCRKAHRLGFIHLEKGGSNGAVETDGESH